MVHIVWEFRVPAEMRVEFERHYNSSGTWAQFFRCDPAYRGTTLLRDSKDSGRYLTVDVWDSLAAYEAFKQKHHDEYLRLDQSFERLTAEECSIGVFEAA